jgi:hypothetical protein
MRLKLACAVFYAAQLATAAEPAPPKASDVLKPPGARLFPSPITDRFELRGSYFSSAIDTQIRVDSSNGARGTDLAAESDFGMRDKLDQGRIELMIRMRERHRMRFDYFKLTRDGDHVLNRVVNFGEGSFLVDDRVFSVLDWRTLNFTYLYSVFHNPRFEMGTGFGVHILDGAARARVPARFLDEEKSGVIAFPTLAVDATLSLSRRFALTARANQLSANVDKSSGSVSDYHGDVQYRWRENAAVGLGYTSLKTNIVTASGKFPGRFVFDVKGPELFFSASF